MPAAAARPTGRAKEARRTRDQRRRMRRAGARRAALLVQSLPGLRPRSTALVYIAAFVARPNSGRILGKTAGQLLDKREAFSHRHPPDYRRAAALMVDPGCVVAAGGCYEGKL